MNLLKEFSINDKCSYLADKDTNTHYKIIENASSLDTSELIERGYRRFGKMYFRPICEGCDECQSIKVDVDEFEFSKSQRRVIKKASFIKSYVQTPTLTQAHLDLFEKYHLHMKGKRDWKYQETTPEHYHNSFVSGHGEFGYEVLYFDEDKLIGVDLIDVLDDGISSIYFYYDPDYETYSLGKLSLYYQIKYAQQHSKKWIYLGYYVKECQSLSYKTHYKPYITLQGRPSEYEEYNWE